jgi:hypothetical protein
LPTIMKIAIQIYSLLLMIWTGSLCEDGSSEILPVAAF